MRDYEALYILRPEMTEEELLEDDAEGGYFDDLAYYEEDD